MGQPYPQRTKLLNQRCENQTVALGTNLEAAGYPRVAFAVKATSRSNDQMNWDRVEGNWKQLTGKVKEQWGKLTDDDITQINGNREQLEGKIQARYGSAKDQVKKDVDDWISRQ
jgi:uncharacterized protein YjbJ (UPF0337 family)